jgi:hypothetical protein
MRGSLLFISLALVTGALAQEPANPPAAARPIDPAKMEQIDKFLKLTHADQMIQQMLGQFEEAFNQGFKKSLSAIPNAANQPGLQADTDSFRKQLFGIVREQLSYDRLKPELIKLYDETFTAQELSGINTFYESPAGRAYLAKIPQLTKRSSQVGVNLMSAAMPQIQKMTADWTNEMKRKYGGAGAK